MRRLLVALVATLMSLVLFAACGRSSIDDYEGTGQGDSGARCGPTTCPSGCCDENGVCRSGTDLVRCGGLGRTCSNCAALAFDTCDPATKACGNTVTGCDARTCPNGCCTVQNGREVCLAGTEDSACGTGGRTCASCSASGLECDTRTRQCGGTACNAETCPNGCCSGARCLPGRDARSCGAGGSQCSDCQAQGQRCEVGAPGVGGRCVGTPTCNAQNCRGGCCQGNTCLPGIDNTACGAGGNSCSTCPNNTQCNAATRRCEARPACGPGNCAGCCVGDVCVNPGDGNTACGRNGAACTNCSAGGRVCQAGACVDGCNAANCPSGCCQGNTCVNGTQDIACGRGGAACTNCTGAGQVCVGQLCQTPCGPATCPGCCQGNTCQAGFLNTRCGSGGVACSDCAAAGQTCDTNQLPRVCAAGGTCPSPYGMCPAGTTTAAPVKQEVCGAFRLSDARVACAGGPNTASCNNYFAFLAATDPTCGTCLADFRFNFAVGDPRGVFKCVAPFVSAACNGATGCSTDCENTSCAMCASNAAEAACRNGVRGGQCQAFNVQTNCITGALVGGALFCNPATYGGNFGAWLEGVGSQYCLAP